MLCDEPTSGLDSFSAFAMMNTLRQLAGCAGEKSDFQQSSRTVLFSIHQPTSDIFHLFTNILLMSAGRIIFHGTVDEAKTLFASIGLPCPQLYNPAEFYVNKISDPKVADAVVTHVKMDDGEAALAYQSNDSYANDDKAEIPTKVPWIRQVFLLSYRATLSFLHRPKHYLIELFILLVSISAVISFT